MERERKSSCTCNNAHIEQEERRRSCTRDNAPGEHEQRRSCNRDEGLQGEEGKPLREITRRTGETKKLECLHWDLKSTEEEEKARRKI